ncbi:MAG: Uma2 family endonuclease [Acidobacteriota bacterium]
MSSQIKQRYYTPEEYLELESVAEYRSEYLEGEIFAMANGSPDHSIISINLTGELRTALRGKRCQPFDKGLKVGPASSVFFFYPDASIVCGNLILHKKSKDVCTNPKVIFEVLSPSTEAYDRGSKFARYRTIESFTDYVLIAQDEPRIEHFSKQKDGSWNLRIVSELKNKIRIPSIGCMLSLAEIYERVKFPEKKSLIKATRKKKPRKA